MREMINLLKHSERIKSELIIASKMLVALEGFKGDELNGAAKMLEYYFNALLTEVGIAYNSTKNVKFKEILDLISNLNVRDYKASMQKYRRLLA